MPPDPAVVFTVHYPAGFTHAQKVAYKRVAILKLQNVQRELEQLREEM